MIPGPDRIRTGRASAALLALAIALAPAVAQAQQPAMSGVRPIGTLPVAGPAPQYDPQFAPLTGIAPVTAIAPVAPPPNYVMPIPAEMVGPSSRRVQATAAPVLAPAMPGGAAPAFPVVAQQAPIVGAQPILATPPPSEPVTTPPAQGAAALPPLTQQQVEQIVDNYLQQRGLGSPPPVAGDGYEIGSDLNFRAVWRHGLVFETPNQDFTLHVGGRLQFDASAFTNDPQLDQSQLIGGSGPIQDSVNLRRARLRLDGTLYDLVEWVSEWEFANVAAAAAVAGNPPTAIPYALTPSPTDVYARFTKLPIVGNFQIGNFKEPIGLEHLTSSRWLDFMERSYNQDVFYGSFNNGFSPGMMIFDWTENERMTYAAWVGPSSNNFYGYSLGGTYAATGRLTYLPYYDADGRFLMHLGSSVSYRSPNQGQLRLAALGDVRSGPYGVLSPVLADTGALLADGQDIFNLEFAAVHGPLSLQAEYAGEWITGASASPFSVLILRQLGLSPGNTMYVQGGYVEAMYFLTGEHRAYNRRAGAMDRVIPHQNAYLVRRRGCPSIFGRGAWQAGIRYSAVDMNSAGVNGGTLHSMTLGLNWFLNPNLKFQWNYDFTHRSSVAEVASGDIHSFGARMAMDF